MPSDAPDNAAALGACRLTMDADMVTRSRSIRMRRATAGGDRRRMAVPPQDGRQGTVEGETLRGEPRDADLDRISNFSFPAY